MCKKERGVEQVLSNVDTLYLLPHRVLRRENVCYVHGNYLGRRLRAGQ